MAMVWRTADGKRWESQPCEQVRLDQLQFLRFGAGRDGGTALITDPAVPLRVNGQPWTGEVKPGGYASVRRQWAAGDRLELDLPLAVQLMEADPRVDDCRNRVAVQRGPVIYCLELPKEQGGEQVWDKGVFLPENIRGFDAIVLNNASLGNIRDFQPPDRKFCTEYPEPDIAAYARASGCAAFKVRAAAELGPALRDALACGGPSVVEVITKREAHFKLMK